MAFSNADLLNIKAELTNDPKALGLTTNAVDDEANADKLNAVRSGDPGFVKTLPVLRQSLTTRAIFNAVDPIEHQQLSAGQLQWYAEMLTLGQINPSTDSGIIDGLDGMFSENSVSRPAYRALLSQDGNRITQLYQAGAVSVNQTVTPSDVANARQAS